MGRPAKNIITNDEAHYIERVVRYCFYSSVDRGELDGKLKVALDKAISRNINKLIQKYKTNKEGYADIRDFLTQQKLNITIRIPLRNLREFPEKSTAEKILNLCKECENMASIKGRWKLDGMFHWGERMVNEMRRLGATDDEFIFDHLNSDIHNLGLIWKTGVTPETMAARHMKIFRSVHADLKPEFIPQSMIEDFRKEIEEIRAKLEIEPEWKEEIDSDFASLTDEHIKRYIETRTSPQHVVDDIVNIP